MDGAYLLNDALRWNAGDLAAVATHEAVVHEHESGTYEGDIDPDTPATNWQIWEQLPARFKRFAPFWREKVGYVEREPLIY
jgi:hypothetical protein